MFPRILEALPLFSHAIYEAILLAVILPLIGIFFVLRRVVFLGVVLPQVASAGVCLSFLIAGGVLTAHEHGGLSEKTVGMLGAISLTLVTLLVLSFASSVRRLSEESKLGILYVASGALSLIALSLDPHGESQMISLLRGDILTTTDVNLLSTGVVFSLCAFTVLYIRKELFLISTDKEFAMSLRLRTKLYEALFYSMSGVAIGYGVFLAGPLIIFSFLVLPAMIALRTASSLRSVFPIAIFSGALIATFGFLVALGADIPLGPSIAACGVLLCVADFVLVSLINSR